VEKYDDTNGFRLGAEYAVKKGLRSGAASSRTVPAAPDETVTPNLPEADRKLYTVGFGAYLGKGFTLDSATTTCSRTIGGPLDQTAARNSRRRPARRPVRVPQRISSARADLEVLGSQSIGPGVRSFRACGRPDPEWTGRACAAAPTEVNCRHRQWAGPGEYGRCLRGPRWRCSWPRRPRGQSRTDAPGEHPDLPGPAAGLAQAVVSRRRPTRPPAPEVIRNRPRHADGQCPSVIARAHAYSRGWRRPPPSRTPTSGEGDRTPGGPGSRVVERRCAGPGARRPGDRFGRAVPLPLPPLPGGGCFVRRPARRSSTDLRDRRRLPSLLRTHGRRRGDA